MRDMGPCRRVQVHARAHLPSLEDKAGIHVECVDTYGTHHRFRYCSWINNSSRMYLLEGVAPALVRRARAMHPPHPSLTSSVPTWAQGMHFLLLSCP